MEDKTTGILHTSGRLLSVIAVLILSAANVFAAKISFMAGDVKVVKGGKAAPAGFQMELNSGDVIKTGRGAFADISYDDGTVVKVKENSSVTIGNKNEQGSEAVSVTSGIINAKFAKLQKDSVRKVYTPTTVCAIRGTEFDVAVGESADSKVQMTEGSLEVLNPYGRAEIREKQNAEIGVAKSPSRAEGGDLGKWMKDNESDLENNPGEKADAFSEYVKNFQKRSESSSKNISNMDRKRSSAIKGGKDKLEKANKDLESLENDVRDDLYLNSAANNSIEGILTRFQNDKKGMYDKFLKVKTESNRVMDQQKRNFEAIAAVKAAYKKAYDDIMMKHKEGINKIKGGFDKESVKPKR